MEIPKTLEIRGELWAAGGGLGRLAHTLLRDQALQFPRHSNEQIRRRSVERHDGRAVRARRSRNQPSWSFRA